VETYFPLNLALFDIINTSDNASQTIIQIAKALAVFTPWLVIAILVWTWVFKTAEVRRSLMVAGIALGLGLLVNFTIAFLIYVPRPFEMGVGISFLSHSKETSFPSDHATFLWSLGLGLLVTQPLRRLGSTIVCLGIAVAWARVYLGVHFPLDMAASLLISSCAALIAKFTADKLDRRVFQPVERLNTLLLNTILRQKNRSDV